MSVAVAQTAHGSSTGTGVATATFGGATTAGSTLIAVVAVQHSSTISVPTPTNAAGTSMTSDEPKTLTGSTALGCGIFRLDNATSTTALKVTGVASGYRTDIWAFELTGTNSAGSFDTGGVASAASTSADMTVATSGSISGGSDALIAVCVTTDFFVSPSTPTGYTAATSPTQVLGALAVYRTGTFTGVQTPDFGAGGGDSYVAAIAAYKSVSVTTSTRNIPASAALLQTNTRSVPTSAALLQTNTRLIPSSAALLASGVTRQVPASAALAFTITRQIPASAKLLATNTRAIPTSAALQALGLTRAVPTSAALLRSGVTRQIPASAALLLTLSRSVPASVALLATLTRSVPSTAALKAPGLVRSIPASAQLFAPVLMVCTCVTLTRQYATALMLGKKTAAQIVSNRVTTATWTASRQTSVAVTIGRQTSAAVTLAHCSC